MLIENGTKLPDGTPLDWNTKMKCIFPNLTFPTGTQTELLDIVDLLCMCILYNVVYVAEQSFSNALWPATT